MAEIKYNNRLRVVLAEQQKTNRWLSGELGVAELTVSRWCTNKTQPSMSQFVTISKLIGVELKDLIEDHE